MSLAAPRSIRACRRAATAALTLLAALAMACARPEELPEDPPPLPVEVEKVARAPFRPSLVLLGVVRSSAEARVVVPMAGALRYPARFARGLEPGTAVRAGELLATLVNVDAEAAIAEAALQLEAARGEHQRYQRGFETGIVSAAQLATYKAQADLAAQRLESARKRRAGLELRAPLAGRLAVDAILPPGGEVQAGTVLVRIAGGGTPRIEARAAAGDRARLRPGLAVGLTQGGAAGPLGRGVVQGLSPTLDAGGTVTVVITADAGATGLPAAGEGIEAHVELDPSPQAISVPEEALTVSQGGSAVFVVEGGVARRRAVSTGGRAGGRIEITNGLLPGDRVVVEGVDLLTEGAQVKATEKPATPAAPAAGAPAGGAARERQ